VDLQRCWTCLGLTFDLIVITDLTRARAQRINVAETLLIVMTETTFPCGQGYELTYHQDQSSFIALVAELLMDQIEGEQASRVCWRLSMER
jgi:hypothetical protein